MRISARYLFSVLLFLMVACGGDNTVNTPPPPPPAPAVPTITSVSPDEISRAQQNATVSIHGTNLSEPSAVTMGAGVNVLDFSAVDSTQIDVNVSVNQGAEPGDRTITVVCKAGTVTNSTAFKVVENIAPKPSFEITPAGDLSTRVTVEFDASSSADPNGTNLKYNWDFGDGNTGQGRKTSHRYAKHGKYVVSLEVKDKAGSTNSAQKELNVGANASPVADFTVKPGKAEEDKEVTFDGSASFDLDGRVTGFDWKFGDGARAQGKIVTHTFKDPKTYAVELVVTDNKGDKSGVSKDIKIEKTSKIKCAGRRGRGEDYFFNVVSHDRSKRTIIARFETDNVCEAFFLCGDIRLGGFPPRSPGKEKWVGIMCEFYDLGNGLAEIKTRLGTYWPESGDRNFYTHAQIDCNPRDCTR